MRIAGIARQKNLAANEGIYSVNDPAEAMYCVVKGCVKLRNEASEERRIEARDTFGVHEILSDRLRHEDAQAEEPTVALVIEAEDFFDLLSNNVEIVKALFRQLLRQPQNLDRLRESMPGELATHPITNHQVAAHRANS